MSQPLAITVVSDVFPQTTKLIQPVKWIRRNAWNLVHREPGNNVIVRVVNGVETLHEYRKELGKVRKVF